MSVWTYFLFDVFFSSPYPGRPTRTRRSSLRPRTRTRTQKLKRYVNANQKSLLFSLQDRFLLDVSFPSPKGRAHQLGGLPDDGAFRPASRRGAGRSGLRGVAAHPLPAVCSTFCLSSELLAFIKGINIFFHFLILISLTALTFFSIQLRSPGAELPRCGFINYPGTMMAAPA